MARHPDETRWLSPPPLAAALREVPKEGYGARALRADLMGAGQARRAFE
jgi:hypothetical protein